MTLHPADPLDEERHCPDCARFGPLPCLEDRAPCRGSGTLPPRNPDAPKVLEVFGDGPFHWEMMRASEPVDGCSFRRDSCGCGYPTAAAALKAGRLATCGCELPCQDCDGEGRAPVDWSDGGAGYDRCECNGTGKRRNVCEVCQRVMEMPDE